MNRVISLLIGVLAACALFASTAAAAPFAQFYAPHPEDVGYPIVDGGMLYRLVPPKQVISGRTELVQRDLRTGLEHTLYSATYPSARIFAIEAGGGRVAVSVKTSRSAKILAFNAAGDRSTVVKASGTTPKGLCLRNVNLGPIAADGTVTWQRVDTLKNRSSGGSGCGIYANTVRVTSLARRPHGGTRTLLSAKRMSMNDYQSLISEGHETSMLALSGRFLLYTGVPYVATLKNLSSGAKENFSSMFQVAAEHTSLRSDGAVIHPSDVGDPVVRFLGAPGFTLPTLKSPPVAKFCGDRIVQASNTDSEDDQADEVVLRDASGMLLRTLYAQPDPHLGYVNFVSCDADFAAVGFTGKRDGLDVRLFDLRG